ncbi:hypothetical protein AN643_02155 [Candidatus Epulonipiscioides saccharophilum]|nr:hypothetical protein AN643_02155 [Epulopiscium sp. SCG-B10WGA-EpuloB]
MWTSKKQNVIIDLGNKLYKRRLEGDKKLIVLKSLKIKDLGFVLSKEYWNMGLMTEALGDLIPYCFETLNMDAITCGHFSDNLKSQRVIEKLDFTFIGEREFNSFPLKRIFSHLKYIKFKKVPVHVGEALGLFEYC